MSSDARIKRSKSKVAMSPSVDVSSRVRSASGALTTSQSLSRTRFRKKSYGFSGIPGVGSHTRRQSSQLGMEFKRPPMIYLNTFQLGPRHRFHVPKVTQVIDEVLDSYYSDTKYSVAESPGKTILIADEVMRAVKLMNFDRYRIISIVTIAQKRAQSYNNAVAFLWDHEFDTIVDTHREDTTSFIQVTVFGVYLD